MTAIARTQASGAAVVVPQIDSPTVPQPAAAATDLSPAQQTERRYLQAVDALVDEAMERSEPEVLVEVLTWTLARIASAYGPAATADVLRRLGGHLGDLAQRQREQETAKREARQAKRKGLRPH
jgi:hypothetical protein